MLPVYRPVIRGPILGRSESLVVFSWERQKLATTGGGLDRFRATPEGEGTSGEEKTPLAAEERPRQRPVVSVNPGELVLSARGEEHRNLRLSQLKRENDRPLDLGESHVAPFVELTPEDRGIFLQPPPPDVTHTNAVNRD